MTRDELQNERSTDARTKIDEDNLGDVRFATGDATDHALTKTGFEAGSEKNDIRNTGRLHGHHRRRLNRPCIDQRSSVQRRRRGGDADGDELEETTEHGDGG